MCIKIKLNFVFLVYGGLYLPVGVFCNAMK